MIFIEQRSRTEIIEGRTFDTLRVVHRFLIVIQLLRFHHHEVTEERLRTTGSCAERDTCFLIALTGFGRNNDNTTGSGSTVNTGSTCIFQYGNSLNVVRIETTTHHAIYDIYRVRGSSNRTCTADTNLRTSARLTGSATYLHTGYLTLQHRSDITGSNVCQFICRNSDYSRTQLGLLHSRITEGNNFLKLLCIRLHDDTHVVNCTHFNRLVAYVR